MSRKIHGETRRVTVRVPVDLLDDIRDQIRKGVDTDSEAPRREL